MAKRGKKRNLIKEFHAKFFEEINIVNRALADEFFSSIIIPGNIQDKHYYNCLDAVDRMLLYGVIHNYNRPVYSWTKRQAEAYVRWLDKKYPHNEKKILIDIRSISEFYDYIINHYHNRYPELENYFSELSKYYKDLSNDIMSELTCEQIDELINSFSESGDYKSALIVSLLACTGRRLVDILQINVSAFNSANLICDGALFLIPTASGSGQEHFICVADKIKPHLERWLEERTELTLQSEWLFPDKSNPDKHLSLSKQTFDTLVSERLNIRFRNVDARNVAAQNFNAVGLPRHAIKRYTYGFLKKDLSFLSNHDPSLLGCFDERGLYIDNRVKKKRKNGNKKVI